MQAAAACQSRSGWRSSRARRPRDRGAFARLAALVEQHREGDRQGTVQKESRRCISSISSRVFSGGFGGDGEAWAEAAPSPAAASW